MAIEKQQLVDYIREKTNRLLEVMGTVRLNPDELDDSTLLSVDPIGIVTESFEQVFEHLHATRNELQAVFDSAGVGIIVVNDRMEVTTYNDYSRIVFFNGQDNVQGRNLRSLVCAHKDQECIMDQILASRRRVEQDDFCHEGHHYHLVGTPLMGADDNVQRMVLLYTDITERQVAALEIERLAFFDSLTGLPNRVLLKDRLEQMITLARRYSEMVAVMFIDLDRFKEVNDTLGHSAGDVLLQFVAANLRSCVRTCDTVARLGGDEFMVILEGIDNRFSVSNIAQKLLDTMSQPALLDGREVYTGGSIGISIFPHDGADVDTLLKNADAAMYHAKEQGRNGYCFYSKDMHKLAFEQLTMGGYLRHAIERNEFHLVFQPQVSLSSGILLGMEVLLRWQHPELGAIMPDRFIPLAEENGLIVPIGAWVLREACMQAVAWIKAGYAPLRVAVNISAKQFRDPGLVTKVATILQESGLPPRLLELELTEGMLIENIDVTRSILSSLKKMGVTLAIDDFGTGYSSLSYLQHFPLDRLKIDKSFISELTEQSQDSTAIVEAIIALGHSLKLTVIAEGVEKAYQVEFLQQRHCDEMQGYYISRPLSSDAFEELLQKEKQGPLFCLFHHS